MCHDIKNTFRPIIKLIKNIYKLLRKMYRILLKKRSLKRNILTGKE